MATLLKTPDAQTVLQAEFTYSMLTADADKMLNTSGVMTQFNKITSAGDTTFDVMTLPPGAQVVGGDISVLTQVVGPTAATLSVGDSASATRYASAVSTLTASGTRTALTITGFITAGNPIRLTLNNTVAAATAGKVKVAIQFTVTGRSNENIKTV